MILYFIIFYFYLGIRAGGSGGGLRRDMDRRSSSSSRRSKLVLLVLVYRLVATWPCCPRAGPWAISCWPDLRLPNIVATATSDSSSLMASLHNPNTRHRHTTEEKEKSWKKRKNKKKGERKKESFCHRFIITIACIQSLLFRHCRRTKLKHRPGFLLSL